MWRAFLIALSFVLPPLASLHAASFDGKWSVLQVCDSTNERTPGYTWRYGATVKHGRLVGQYRSKGQRPSLTLEGQVNSDGSASLVAEGLSAASESDLGFESPQGRFSFRVNAKFETMAGIGRRVGVRGCRFIFSKL